MHPLSLFPSLLSYPFLAYFILRLVVAWGVLRVGVMRWRKPYKWMTVLHSIAGILVLIGLYTQPALIACIILLIIDVVMDNTTGLSNNNERLISMIIGVVAFSLLFLGPGSFAFDLPL
jgi:uncharacterized membrane protein YphA (DoxX/SURF4 family)